ncbi:MAG: hypothetical protein R3Y46_02020 [Opitutales bacterium]
MMSLMYKRLFVAILSLLSFFSVFSYAKEKAFDSDVVFFISPQDVLSTYEGKWAGSKQLYLKGKLLGDTVVDSSNTLLSNNLLSYSRQERLLDKPLLINATILSLGNKLYMSTKDDNNKDVIYEGIIKSNSVEWFRAEKIFAYDYTKDIFIKKGDEMLIQTYSVKPFATESSLMYIEYKGTLSKGNPNEPALEINEKNLDISKLRM